VRTETVQPPLARAETDVIVTLGYFARTARLTWATAEARRAERARSLSVEPDVELGVRFGAVGAVVGAVGAVVGGGVAGEVAGLAASEPAAGVAGFAASDPGVPTSERDVAVVVGGAALAEAAPVSAVTPSSPTIVAPAAVRTRFRFIVGPFLGMVLRDTDDSSAAART
jgi:hypothetical protein